MNAFMFADAAALSAPVVFVTLMSIVVLLSVRAYCGVMGITLSRLASQLLDGSVAMLFLLFMVLVVVRFKIIG
jgi:hypothetical protein